MYRLDDIDMINKNLSKIQDDASKEYKTNNEPTLTDISYVYNSIKEYIKKNKKLVYGGFAQNLLIHDKKPDESFYKEIDGAYYNWPDLADIEFYSPDPIKDTIELVDYLHSKGFKNIQGKEGVHHETYKIFVNFLNYCDISYVPPNIFEKIPYIEIQGIRCTHPHFMLVDAYRVLTDPMTSYWRVDKSIKRFQKLLRYYPMDKINQEQYNKVEFNTMIPTKDLQFIRRKIIHKSRLIVVGFYAYDYYMKKTDKQYMLNRYPYYEVISTDYIKDSKYISYIMKKKYNDRLIVKEYNPYFNFTDERTEFYLDDKLVLILYGNNKRCIVYRYSENKTTYFGTFNLVYMYMLFAYYINMPYHKIYKILTSHMIYGRNKYLDTHNITVVDKSPFQDFTIKCIGKPDELTHDKMLNSKQAKFIYYPGMDKIKLYKNDYFNNSGLKKI